MVNRANIAAQTINMTVKTTKILLVEDNPGDARLIELMLASAGDQIEIEWVSTLTDGLKYLQQGDFDLVLLDLGLPESQGLDTFLTAYSCAPQIPFVVLSGLDDANLGLKAVQQGAQDYLTKGRVDGEMLLRSIRYATERKRGEEALRLNEERFRLTFDQSPIGAAIISLDYRYIRVNQNLCAISGYSEEELTAMGFQAITHPEDVPEIVAKAEDLVDGKIDQYQMEKRTIRKDGKMVWIQLSVRLMKDAYGKPLYFLSMMEDITKRKQAEEELKKYREHLEKLVELRTIDLTRANKRLQEQIKERKKIEEALKKSSEKMKLFAYSVSHDLKNPAIGIYGLTKLLQKHYRDNLDDKGKNYCDLILRSAEQISTLVENINVYITTKELPLKIKRVNLKELLQIIKEDSLSQLNIRQIKWSEPECIPDIRADKLSIMRALRNLVDNALKYGGDDLSEIKIAYAESAEFITLSVSDDGVGINLADPAEVFGLFKRSDTSVGVEGSGLGLAIVKEIAEQHGGKVWVKPNKNRGTTFSFSILKPSTK